MLTESTFLLDYELGVAASGHIKLHSTFSQNKEDFPERSPLSAKEISNCIQHSLKTNISQSGLPLSAKGIESLIGKLKKDKALGPDLIPLELLMENVAWWVPLWAFFTHIGLTGDTPEAWKKSIIYSFFIYYLFIFLKL